MRFAILLLLAGVACADLAPVIPSQTAYRAQLDGYRGHPINVVIAKLGPPDKVVDMAQGTKLYVFEHRSSLRTQRTSIAKDDPEHNRVIVEHHGGERIPIDCLTQVETDVGGRVVRSSFEGLACVAFAQTPSPGDANPPPVTAPVAESTPGGTVPDAELPAASDENMHAAEITIPDMRDPDSDTKRRKKRLFGGKKR